MTKNSDEPDSHPQLCPKCENEIHSLIFYSCCLEPACQQCYNGFHYFECKKKTIDCDTIPMAINHAPNRACQRCDKIPAQNESSYICKQCKASGLCSQCLDETHKGKFTNHRIGKASKIAHSQVLQCKTHKKLRTIISEKSELICSQCVSQYKVRKSRQVDYSCKQEIINKIQSLTLQIQMKKQQHLSKWDQLKQSMRSQYQQILERVNEKYQHNLSTIEKIQQCDMRIIDAACKASKQYKKQLSLNLSDEFKSSIEIYISRLFLIFQQLMKQKRVIMSTESFWQKVGEFEFDKLEALLKNFTINKIKTKQDDNNKENNGSVRMSKSVYSNNLSVSRRSLSKSVNKASEIGSSMKKMKNSQIITKSTGVPNHRASSIISSKLEDIEPIALTFDSKQTNTSNRSRINYLSSKTEEELKQQSGVAEKDQSCTNIFNRPTKRKSDYFDLRERMKKPNIVGNNRFLRK